LWRVWCFWWSIRSFVSCATPHKLLNRILWNLIDGKDIYSWAYYQKILIIWVSPFEHRIVLLTHLVSTTPPKQQKRISWNLVGIKYTMSSGEVNNPLTSDFFYFLAHLSWKLKWAFLIARCPASVCLSVRLSVRLSVCKLLYFRLLLQNHWANFNQTWLKSSLGQGDSSLFKWRAMPFSKGR
jgi:hypothetical protein